MSDNPKVTNPQQCPYCSKIFSKTNQVTKHMPGCKAKHMAADEYKHKCPCSKGYKHEKSLNRHQKECATYQSTQNNTNSGSHSQVLTNTGNNNTINNTNTTNNNPVININPVGKETFDHLTKADIDAVLHSGKGAFKKLAYLMYSHTENKNLCFHNRKDDLVKHVNLDGNVDIGNTKHVLNMAVTSVEDQLDEYISEFCKSSEKNDNSPLGRLLTELSEQNSEGVNDDKHMSIIYKLVIVISEVAKTLLRKYELQRRV
jgi:hypothetical protein